jgi:hypothetical protein
LNAAVLDDIIPQLQLSFVPVDSFHTGKRQTIGKSCECGVFISIPFGHVYLLGSVNNRVKKKRKYNCHPSPQSYMHAPKMIKKKTK